MTVYRFVGDPAGYVVDHVAYGDSWDRDHPPSVMRRWSRATVGSSDRHVWIDTSKAYMVDPEEEVSSHP